MPSHPLTLRPTTARVRQALFNIWQGQVAGRSFLDLCTGTGAVAEMALTLGATPVVAIERANRPAGQLRQRWSHHFPNQTWQVITGTIPRCLGALTPPYGCFDRIFLDPPYDAGLYLPTLAALAHLEILHPQGELAVEHRLRQPLPPVVGHLHLSGQRVYGDTALSFYQAKP
ncbi:MAG: RsmD family RNA methyltransferase [Gloeomargaritaceae cyanobacterium C42_A2020_066]|nr:RsmD family RNA methyltransferase [Gloeomargaritaceae cyanobacterium C42_A2020_066]